MTLFLFFMAFLSSLYFILRPLYQKQEFTNIIPEDPNYLKLQEQKNTVFTALKDLDFEHDMGKLSAHDYEQLRQELKEEAAQVLSALDPYDEWIENELQLRRAKPCPSCKSQLPPNARFCPQCGAAI